MINNYIKGLTERPDSPDFVHLKLFMNIKAILKA